MSLTEDLVAAQTASGFSITDMGTWFGVNRETMRTWLLGRRPGGHRLPQIQIELKLLQLALRGGVDGYDLPVPLSVTQYERRAYIEGVRNAIANRILTAHTAA